MVHALKNSVEGNLQIGEETAKMILRTKENREVSADDLDAISGGCTMADMTINSWDRQRRRRHRS